MRTLAAAMVFLLATAAAQARAPAAKIVDEKGCKLAIPTGWHKADGKSYGQTIMIFAPFVRNLAPNIGLLVAEPFPKFGYDAIAKSLLDRMKDSIQGFQLISQRPATIDGQKAVETTGYETIPQIGSLAKFDQYVILGKKHSYVITLTAPADQAARYETVFSQVIRSLKIAH